LTQEQEIYFELWKDYQSKSRSEVTGKLLRLYQGFVPSSNLLGFISMKHITGEKGSQKH